MPQQLMSVHVGLDESIADAPRNATSTAYEASRVIKKGPGFLYGLSGYSSRGSAQWIQIFDAATLPADQTLVPVITFTVATVANFSLDFGLRGRFFESGIVVCNSSTGPTKTIGSADCWFDAQYS